MRIEHRIASNAIVLGAGEAIAQVANFAFSVVLARQFGPQLLGEYSLALAVGATAAVLVSLGVYGVLTREIGHEPRRGHSLVGIWLPAQLVTVLVACGALAIAAKLMPVGDSFAAVLVIVGAYQVIWRCSHLFTLQFSARGSMVLSAVAEASHRLAILGFGAAAIALGAPPAAALAVMPAVALMGVALTAWRAGVAFGVPPVRSGAKALRALLERAWPFFLLAVLATVEIRFGIVLLGAVSGSEEAGVYAAADRLVLPILLVQGLIIRSAYPAMLRLWTTDRAALQQIAGHSSRVMLVCSIPLAALAFVLHDAVPLVFGSGFQSSATILAVLAWLPVPAGLKYLWHSQALAINAERQATVATAASIAATAAVTLLAAPRYGALALAAAVLIGQVLQAAMLYMTLARKKMAPQVLAAARAPAYAAVIAVACAAAVDDYGLAASGTVAVIAIIAGLWMFRAFERDELRRFFGILRRPLPRGEKGSG